MAAADQVERLSGPLAPTDPCGPDLGYDADFAALQRAAEGTPERESGAEIRPAQPPDWDEVESRAVKLLGRSRDARAAVLLARAWLASEGLAGLAAGVGLLSRLLEQFWDQVHPRADEDGDLMLRFNSIAALVDDALFLQPLRVVPLVNSRQFGRFSLRDQRLATGKLRLPNTSGETPPERNRIESAFSDARLEDLQGSREGARQAFEAVTALQKLIDSRASGTAPSLQPLQVDLRDIVKLYDEVIAKRSGLELDLGDGGGFEPASNLTRSGPAIAGLVRTRPDVVRALDAVCAYYRDSEPSSPVPMLLTRAKRLVNMSYLEIVRDLTPAGATEAESLAGVEKSLE